MSLKNDDEKLDIFLKFFNKKNSYRKRRSSLIIDNIQIFKQNNVNNSKLSSVDIKANIIDSLNKLEKENKNNRNSNNINNEIFKNIEDEDINNFINSIIKNLGNEKEFLINKGIELQKRGLKKTGDVKKALEAFLNKSELIERLMKNSNFININNNNQQVNDYKDKNNNGKKTSVEENIHSKIKTLISKLADSVIFEKYEKSKFIIKMNDIGKDCYFLISGKISILKPVEYKHIEITYEDYFKYLLNLLEKKEMHIFKRVLELNWHFIKIYDEENLIDIVKYYIQNRISVYSNISFSIYEKNKNEDLTLNKIEILLSEYKLNFDHFNLSKEQILKDINEILSNPDNKNNNINIQNKINIYFRQLFKPTKQTIILMSPFEFLFEIKNHGKEDNNKKYVTLYKYEIFMFLEPGSFFGEMSLEIESKRRNATIRAEEDCILISLNNQQYENLILDDNKKINLLRINFLCTHFFFNKISTILFNKYYYPMFKYINKKKDEIIYKQESKFNSLFFLKEGTIKYEIYASIIDIHELINFLIFSIKNNKKLKLDNNYISYLKQNYLKNKSFINLENSNIILKEKIVEKKKFEISICNLYETLGLQEYFLDIGHMCTCYVSSENAKLFEISKNSLNKIIIAERDIKEDYYNLVLNKIVAFIKRLYNIENIFIKQTQFKIKTNFFEINDSNYISELKRENNILKNIEKNKNNPNSNLKDELRNENNSDDLNHISKKLENFGHIEESIIKKNNNHSQIKFEKEEKNIKSILEAKNYETSKNFKTNKTNLKKININKITKITKNLYNQSTNNSTRRDISNDYASLRRNNSSIIKSTKNSKKYFFNKNKKNTKTIVNLGSSFLSLPQLKKRLLSNKDIFEIKNANLSIVKNDFPIESELSKNQQIKNDLFKNLELKSLNKIKPNDINFSINSKSNITYRKENYLPNIKINDSPGFNYFKNKMKNNLNLSRLKSNSESKLNNNKEINILNFDKKDNELVKYVKDYYQKQKNKGYSAIINPVHNTIIKHKLVLNNKIKVQNL